MLKNLDARFFLYQMYLVEVKKIYGPLVMPL